jgi:hypothetical protein
MSTKIQLPKHLEDDLNNFFDDAFMTLEHHEELRSLGHYRDATAYGDLYRGLSLDKEMEDKIKDAGRVEEKRCTSWTYDIEVARNCGNVVIRVKPSDYAHLIVFEASRFVLFEPDEKEIILAPGIIKCDILESRKPSPSDIHMIKMYK